MSFKDKVECILLWLTHPEEEKIIGICLSTHQFGDVGNRLLSKLEFGAGFQYGHLSEL